MRILGIDISTYTGLCFSINGTEFQSEVINFPSQKGMQRLQSIADAIDKRLEVWKPTLCIIEGYSYASKFMIINMIEIGAIVRNTVYRRGIPYYDVPPKVVKVFAGAPGNAKKKVVAKAVEAQWGFTSPSDDIVDAYILNRIGITIAKFGRVPTSLVKGTKYECSTV